MPCRLQTAIENVGLEQSGGSSAFAESSKGSHPSAKHLKPITQAMELVFGSAAAISAAFGLKVTPRTASRHGLLHASLSAFCLLLFLLFAPS